MGYGVSIPHFFKTKVMRYIYFIIVVIVVLFLAFHLIPIAFALFRVLIGLGGLLLFGLGFWVGTYFPNKNKNEESI